MANLVPCYAVAGHRGALRCPGFVRRLVISCDIPRRGDLDGFFRIRVLTRVILVVLQACFHMSKYVQVKFCTADRRTLCHSCFWICDSGISCKKLSERDASVSTLGLHLKIRA